MEMERINDDTFLLRIENQDLIDRGTSIPELLGNPGEIEGFFHSILEEMGVLNQFEDSDGLSFQIMPNADGLDLKFMHSINKYFGMLRICPLSNAMPQIGNIACFFAHISILQHSLGSFFDTVSTTQQ